MNTEVDILVIGAGISGIGLSYYIQQRCPQKSLMVLEGRKQLGGTWSLFKYPGVRSDSDMFTYGYQFNPWTEKDSLATGARIYDYLKGTAEKFGIDKHIRYEHKVTHLNWNSDIKRWEVQLDTPEGTRQVLACYVLSCTGYYDYKQGHAPEFENSDEYQGIIVHPQLWPENLDYRDKKVVVIGSGATAVTLVPSIATHASHVTMLQRSPSYILSRPQRDFFTRITQSIFSTPTASKIIRERNIWLGNFYFKLMTKYPELAKKIVTKERNKLLYIDIDASHFSPTYNPWEQRLCLVPDADLFNALNRKRASIVTDTISRFTHNGIITASGQHIDADIVVTATGLKLQFLSGVDVCIDNVVQETGEKMFYQGALLQDIPNFAMIFGYTNASWTLKVELVSKYICRLINHIDTMQANYFVPTAPSNITPEPFLNLSSGYIQRAQNIIPKQGQIAPWRLDQDYNVDKKRLATASLDDVGLKIN